jgi:hypothetical protein
MLVTAIVPENLSDDDLRTIQQQWPTRLGIEVDREAAETIAATLRAQITADKVREQLARPEEERSRL